MSERQMRPGGGVLDPRMALHGKLKAFAEVIDWAPRQAGVASAAWNDGTPSLRRARHAEGALSWPASTTCPIRPGSRADRPVFVPLFCGFPPDRRLPDETTLCRFRNDCIAAAFGEGLCRGEQTTRRQGTDRAQGTIIDATIVNRRFAPAAGGGGSKALVGPRARRVLHPQGGKSTSATPAIGVDAGPGSFAAGADAGACHGAAWRRRSSGRRGRRLCRQRLREQEARRALKARRTKDRIMHRGHSIRRSALLARAAQRLDIKRRAPVERVFGNFKRLYRRARARYADFLHNLGDFQRLATVYNLRSASDATVHSKCHSKRPAGDPRRPRH